MTARSVRDDWLLPTLQSLVDAEQLTQLREGAHESLWDAAVRRGLVSDDDILAALSARFRMPIADLSAVAPNAKELVPESLARKYRILPLRATDSALDIATADPHDLDCERTLGFATGRTIRMHLAAPIRISDRIDEIYRPENRVEKLLEGMTQYDVQSLGAELPDEDLDLSSKASERPIIKLVDHIVAEGIQQRASDIHLESQEAGIVVVYRVDGVLRQSMVLPKAVGIPLVSRVKIMSGLDIADRLRPQDGRARVSVNGVRVDLRVSTLPHRPARRWLSGSSIRARRFCRWMVWVSRRARWSGCSRWSTCVKALYWLLVPPGRGRRRRCTRRCGPFRRAA
jgi:hypothetical protein